MCWQERQQIVRETEKVVEGYEAQLSSSEQQVMDAMAAKWQALTPPCTV